MGVVLRHGEKAPQWLSDAVEFMDLNAHRPLSLAEVAIQVGVTPRSLQKGFRQYLKTTPHNYLTKVRLSSVHQELQAANPSTDCVSAIARRWQFSSPGRFSDIYRRQFRVCPRETLGQNSRQHT